MSGFMDLDRQKDLSATFGVRFDLLAYQHSRLVQNPREIKTVLHCLITYFVPKKHFLGGSGDLDQQKDLPATFRFRTTSLAYQQSRLVQNPRKIKTVSHCLITFFMIKKKTLSEWFQGPGPPEGPPGDLRSHDRFVGVPTELVSAKS